jgi:hypothetical protein
LIWDDEMDNVTAVDAIGHRLERPTAEGVRRLRAIHLRKVRTAQGRRRDPRHRGKACRQPSRRLMSVLIATSPGRDGKQD